MGQRVEALTGDDEALLDSYREWVRGHFPPGSEGAYDSVEGKLSVVAAILSNRWVGVGETHKLQALGIAFGDALAQEVGLEWVAVEDEYGRDPALHHPERDVLMFPRTTISKRVEADEPFDVYELFGAALTAILEARNIK